MIIITHRYDESTKFALQPLLHKHVKRQTSYLSIDNNIFSRLRTHSTTSLTNNIFSRLRTHSTTSLTIVNHKIPILSILTSKFFNSYNL